MKGATPLPAYDILQYENFNPRTHEGCDKEEGENMEIDEIFQSTHP